LLWLPYSRGTGLRHQSQPRRCRGFEPGTAGSAVWCASHLKSKIYPPHCTSGHNLLLAYSILIFFKKINIKELVYRKELLQEIESLASSPPLTAPRSKQIMLSIINERFEKLKDLYILLPEI
jgi:hypothetical protein